jgi:hypothetical protein
MYDFVFFIIYSQQLQKNRSETFSRYNGSLIASLALLIHIGFIYAIIRKVFFKEGGGYGVLGQVSTKIIPILILILGFFIITSKELKKY